MGKLTSAAIAHCPLIQLVQGLGQRCRRETGCHHVGSLSNGRKETNAQAAAQASLRFMDGLGGV